MAVISHFQPTMRAGTMSVEPFSLLENDILSPAREMGAFEALWANGIASNKQLCEKLTSAMHGLLSNLVDNQTADQFYQQTQQELAAVKINDAAWKLAGTIDYPDKLRDADYPLPFIYYRGLWDLVFSSGVSIVGTRHPSSEGLLRARRLTKALVEKGYTIYSGLASGIDTVAHETAIASGGRTIAVIGTPLSICYPKQNKSLQEEIAKNQLLISQVPIISYAQKGIKFTRLFFPERNKTMAALSEATIIVEAGETSGTLIQARAALKQGRKVMILKNNFDNPQLTWPHKLEKMGAIPVRDVDEILQGLLSANFPTTKN